MKINFKIGFSLAELMVVLLLVSLLITALVPIVTKKHLNLPKRSEHGSYMCYYKDGKLYEKKTINRYNGQSEEKQVANCVFTPPAKALYFQISAVGGGGGGGDSGYTGGNMHAAWKDIETISPFGLQEETIRKKHIIYKDKGYFPPNTSEGDLSATLYSYAKSYDSRKGGDVGNMSCSISSGGGKYYNTTGTSGDIPACPKLCTECPTGESYSCSWHGKFYAPGGKEWVPGKPYSCNCTTSEHTVHHDPTYVCDEYNYTNKKEYACKGSSSYSSTPPSADECGSRGCCSTKTTKVKGNCKTGHWVEHPDTVAKTKHCDTCYGEGYWKSASSPVYHSDSWSGYCCHDCPEDKVTTNEACEKKRAELLAEQEAAGTTWGGSGYCYFASGFTHSFDSGVYTGSGGAKGNGVKCKKEVPHGTVYGLSITENVSASSDGYDGDNVLPNSVNAFSPAAVTALSGQTKCLDGSFSVNCNESGDWSNVSYSLFTIADEENSYSAKAYNAPLSGTGATTIGITTGGLDTYARATYDNRYISDNRVGVTLCSDDNTFVDGQLCPATTAYDDAVEGIDGSNGKCSNDEDFISAASFCNIPSSSTTAYCMKHHSEYNIGKDKTTGSVIKVPEYEPNGSGYRYRTMYNENYLQYGNAGSPGEVKTLVVRSLKNMDTTIKVGRGGAGGVKGSGANGQSGSATSMGQIIIAEGGQGGEGNLITQTDILPGYDENLYAEGKFVKTSGQVEGALAKASGFLTNMFSYLKSLKEDSYDEIFNDMGKGGKGGGVTHNCWAGQFVVWFEGQILTKTSIFNGKAGTTLYPSPDKLLGDPGYWQTVPSGAAGYVPDSCKTNYEIIEAESGTDGAILIKW